MVPSEKQRKDAVAYLLALFERSSGIHPRAVYGENLASRSRRALAGIDVRSTPLRRRITFEHLKRDSDLLDETGALDSDALKLQASLVKLSSDEPRAFHLMSRAPGEAPVTKLFWALLTTASEAGAKRIDIDFASVQQGQFPVRFEKNGTWVTELTVPQSLKEPLSGCVERLAAVGYDALLTFANPRGQLPTRVEIENSNPDRPILTIGTE